MSLVTFLLGCGVRCLAWQDATLEAGKIQTAVTGDYKFVARLLLTGGYASFFDARSPLANPDTLGHPPGYSFLIAALMRRFESPDAPLQILQIVCDAAAAVLLLLIAVELVHVGAALTAALMAAVAPQFAWNSVVLLPDTLAVLPLLAAVLLLVRACTRGRRVVWSALAAGALIGLSCWLRANAMLAAPFLAVVLMPLVEGRRAARLGFAGALVGGMLLLVAPLTVRNAYVLGHFVPLSLGAGQTLLEGIADYDREGRFGIPRTDLGIMRQEAEASGNPRDAETLFGAQGVARERARLRRGFQVIGSHPVWFAGVMLERATDMLRLERAPRISALPHVSHPLTKADELTPVWRQPPAQLKSEGVLLTPGAALSLVADGAGGERLLLTTGASKYGRQFASAPFSLKSETDYLFRLSLRVEWGRVSVGVLGEEGEMLASTIVEATEGRAPEAQPVQHVRLPFVSLGEGRGRLVIGNAAPAEVSSVVELEAVELVELGVAARTWLRYPRAVLGGVQQLFLTAVFLPLSLGGLLLLARARMYRTLLLLLSVPAYYLCVQSILHTEYRYVLALHYFLFVAAACALLYAVRTALGRAGGRRT